MIDILETQTKQFERHLEWFKRAQAEDRIYPCDCSRKEVLAGLAAIASAPHSAEPEYSGHCRNRTGPLSNFRPKETLAWRWRSSEPSGAHDAIVARTARDGSAFAPGYHWACSIDDASERYHVLVRAWDLAAADLVQREIRNWILKGFAEPVVFHTSLVTQNDGHRLEKRTRGVSRDELTARGISTEKLIESFKSNFDLNAAIKMIGADTRPAGEIDRSVTLSRLSL